MPATDSPVPADLLARVQELPAHAKRWLADWLATSDEESDDPEAVRAAWREEIAQRIQRIKRGEAILYTPEEVEQAMEKLLAEGDSQ